MRLVELVQTSRAVASTRSRKAKTGHLAALLRRLPTPEVGTAVMYLTGELPQGRIGIGYAKVRDTRDVPAAAEPTLELDEVHRTFDEIRDTGGAGSTARRMAQLRGLLARATAEEQAFLRHLLIGELRQGALEGSLLAGIAEAADVPLDAVRRAQMLSADLAQVARAALTEGAPGLARFDLQLFAPVQPMLAQTAETVDEALERLGVLALELKLDGARVQVHKDGDEVRVYSRRLNEVSAAVPELVEQVRALPARRLILDGETIALKPDGAPLPFQVTMRRFGRRLDVDALRAKLPLTSLFFDCLLVDDESLFDAPTARRIEALAAVAPDAQRVPRIVTDRAAEAQAFLRDAFDRGHEGAMAKSLEAPYEAGSRGAGWLKLKQAHTLDLVVLAAEWGSGRRKGWLSNLHLGARDPASGQLVMLGKTFKGLTDARLAWQTEALLARKTHEEGHVVFVRPELVVEIAVSDVQTSPHYPAGLALRFARVKRYRDDKSPADADTLDRVRALHVPIES